VFLKNAKMLLMASMLRTFLYDMDVRKMTYIGIDYMLVDFKLEIGGLIRK
jgi:hypothetical protein